MSNPFLGQVVIFAGTFAPKGWAFCNGQMLSISQNTALFSLLGTTYGGDGRTTFGLPDLRGRVAVSQGQGPGLSNYTLGEQTGAETVTLGVAQMPSHNHNVLANPGTPNQGAPTGNFLAQTVVNRTGGETYTNTAPAGASFMASSMIQSNGGSQPHNNIQPTLALNYIIALQGIFPSRD